MIIPQDSGDIIYDPKSKNIKVDLKSRLRQQARAEARAKARAKSRAEARAKARLEKQRLEKQRKENIKKAKDLAKGNKSRVVVKRPGKANPGMSQPRLLNKKIDRANKQTLGLVNMVFNPVGSLLEDTGAMPKGTTGISPITYGAKDILEGEDPLKGTLDRFKPIGDFTQDAFDNIGNAIPNLFSGIKKWLIIAGVVGIGGLIAYGTLQTAVKAKIR